jgi:hypothetical protein
MVVLFNLVCKVQDLIAVLGNLAMENLLWVLFGGILVGGLDAGHQFPQLLSISETRWRAKNLEQLSLLFLLRSLPKQFFDAFNWLQNAFDNFIVNFEV